MRKVRRLGNGSAIGGFAGATADAFMLWERLEQQLEAHPGQLTRAAVELAKAWRTYKYLRRLDATMVVADAKQSLTVSGGGDPTVAAAIASAAMIAGRSGSPSLSPSIDQVPPGVSSMAVSALT